jgi:hypothetical protein
MRPHVAVFSMVERITLAEKLLGRLRWPLLIGALSAALIWAVSPPQDLGLRAHPVKPGQVRIEWRRSRPVLAARSAVLEIRDGQDRLEIALSDDRLRYSSLTYAQVTAHVTVRMRLTPRDAGAPLEETIFIAGQPAYARRPTVQMAAAKTIAPAPIARVTAPVETQRREVSPAPQAPPPQGTADRIVARHPLQLPPSTPASAAAGPLEALPLPPAVESAPATMTAPLLAKLNVAPNLNLPAPKPVISTQPRSGRLIWTGSLARRGVLEIEGGHATVGALSGELPGIKVSLRISPAEFVEGGLVVYTGEPSAARRTEAAAKSNGWNATRFEWDPERAHQVVVLEAPNPSNEFKRLALRSDLRSCSVILVDWSLNSN